MADPTPLLGLDRDNIRVALNKLDLMGGLLGSFAPDMDTIVASTRTFGYRGARFRDGLGGVTFEPDGTIVCTDDAISFVQYDTVGGVTIAATLDEAKYAIAEVTCASGAITHIEDLRDLNLHDVPGLYLDDLFDVEIYDPQHDDEIRYDSALSLWVNKPSTSVSGGGYPTGMSTTQEVVLTADAGIGLSDGSAITTWGNQGSAGAGKDHANSGGTDRPIFRATDSEDGLEYVEFDGSNDFVEAAGITAYTGGELTAYLVARITDNANADRLWGLAETGQSDTNAATGVALAYHSQHQVALMRDGLVFSGTSLPSNGGKNYDTAFGWFVHAIRYKVLMGRAVVEVYHNNRRVGFDLGGASLVAFNIQNSILGGGYGVAAGTKSGFPRMDVRHWSYRLAADTAIQVRDSMRYLANKWKVPILD